ncbi:MAG: acyl-CoA thioesterase [Candidatus Marinimicrobia bacterium]|jgi:acyl-CoA thioester hydrolase|nr:acyl-CoA thioesterase [Candidatus Neomarinimicrobiota bacterium]MBT3848613.1 acyl-CoA thioesterase [Candidatus Neomarinimicrobiota bacterium]MBT4660914.1 acyl-CoA thioesterase [Candidatus Neomarinimicrobiota bacterium]MBT4827511.1 acyl-CoA thioesterase [Candidatus Neomarinimicrobiota bacterium]MBT5224828.1 acyl-CoA thioesterase [Candidatus Neomarinimicrobiota bacterium]
MIRYDHPITVYYKDIDQMGIVYYSRYFEYFEEARTEMLSSIGLDYSNIEENGAMLPVIEAHCEYKKGATFSQDLIVKTYIRELPKVKMKFEYKICPAGSDEILLSGYTVHACTNLKGKPIKMPKYIRKILQDNLDNL